MEHVGGKLNCLTRQLSRKVDGEFATVGRSGSQMWLIGFLDRHECEGKTVCQKDVEKALGIRASSVTSLITALEEDGLIMRESVDGRTKIVRLTESGRITAKFGLETLSKIDALMLKGLSDCEIKQFFAILDKMENNLKGE